MGNDDTHYYLFPCFFIISLLNNRDRCHHLLHLIIRKHLILSIPSMIKFLSKEKIESLIDDPLHHLIQFFIIGLISRYKTAFF